MSTNDISTPARARRQRPRRRALLASALALLIAVACAAGWALNRYVIDHVEISDVASYEAEQQAQSAASAEPTTGHTRSTPASTNGKATADGKASTEPATGDSNTQSTTGATVTATTYEGPNASLTISQHTLGSGSNTITYYVAEADIAEGTALRSAFANNQFGQSITARTSDIAESMGAIFAINGDYYGFRTTGIVIRNGVIYRDEPARQGLAIYRDGHMEIYEETTTNAEELLAAGVWNTLSFGPALVEEGSIVPGIDSIEIDTNFGNHSIQGNQPRTIIGQKADGTFVFVVIDGRERGYSRGATMIEAAQIMLDLGCESAYNLDGGGSSTMYFNGSVINEPSQGHERGTSDVLYIEDLS